MDMNQACPQQNPPTLGVPEYEELETRRAQCLTEVLSHGIVRIMRHSISTEKTFFCRSDLRRLWIQESSVSDEYRPLDAVLYQLSKEHREIVLENLILFISFLVFVGVSPAWFSTCGSKFFGQYWHPSTQLDFKDDDGAVSEEQLRKLGLTPTQAAHWQEQYMFRPASIIFDPDEWRQEVKPWQPLPFELVHRDDAAGSIFHVEESD